MQVIQQAAGLALGGIVCSCCGVIDLSWTHDLLRSQKLTGYTESNVLVLKCLPAYV